MLRSFFWLIALFVAAIVAFSYGQITVHFNTPSVWRVWLFSLLGVTGMLSVFLFPRFEGRRSVLLAIWVPAALLRILLLPTVVSDDVSRYLFEGKLVRAGISPYVQTADADSLMQYRDDQWATINHKDKLTAYPPLAQLIFASIGFFSYQLMMFKLVFVLADLLVLGAILKLLGCRGISLSFSGFYALNPIVLIAYAGEGHFDSLMLAALLWGLCAYESGRKHWAVILASIATGIKWITLPLIPFFFGKRFWFGLLIAMVTLVLPGIFFWDSIPSLLQGLLVFGGKSHFNGPLYGFLLESVELPRFACSGIVLSVFSTVVFWRWIIRDYAPIDGHLRWILGTLIFVSPIVHFWYLAWILPLICLYPSLPWLTFSVTAGCYFFVWINANGSMGWGLNLWQQGLFWGPFVFSCVYEVLSTKGRILRPILRSKDVSSPSFAVVVPTLNAGQMLSAALESIRQQTVTVSEVIVVDAGSEDGTVEIAKAYALPMHILSSGRGRGMQIAAGIEAAKSDWVLVLHADAVLASNAIDCIQRVVGSDRKIIGGALGQRFMSESWKLLPIEVLNDLRALFTRTAFGDQVQFFHRKTTLNYRLMPKQPLMEDVESSWRIRELGGFAFLNQPCFVSHEKWHLSNWVKRVYSVLRIVLKYRWARLRGEKHAEVLSGQLYSEYYLIKKE